MPSNRTTLVRALVIIAALIIIGAAAYAVHYMTRQDVSDEEPVELVNDFYRAWLANAQASTSDPASEVALYEWPYLGKELREKIRFAPDGIDPVLCQAVVPGSFALRVVSETDERAEFVVTARNSESTEQAIVTARSERGGWYLSDIRCAPGEYGPEREFSFDREGTLEQPIPEDAGAAALYLALADGQRIPLFFGATSVCVAADGAEGACSPDAFEGSADARVAGEMTELGVEVARLELR